MAKQAVANSPFNGGQQPTNVDYSTAEKVKSAILNGDLTPEQATEIAENILNGQRFTELNSTQSAYIAMMKRDSSFNEYQWSLDWLYNHLLTSGSAQAEFYQVATGQKEPINLPASISKTMVSSSDNNTEENPDEPGEKDSVGQNPADMSQENSDHSEKQKIEGALPTGDTSPMWYVLLAAGSSSVLLGRQMRRRKNK